MNCLKPYRNAKYVTIKHPFLKNFDNYGVPGGAVKSVVDAACDTIKVVYCLISSVSYLLHISGKILIANGKVVLLIVMLDNHSVDKHVYYRVCATFFLGPFFKKFPSHSEILLLAADLIIFVSIFIYNITNWQ